MILALWIGTAAAESWCAGPLVAHEWGVTVLVPGGGVVQSSNRLGVVLVDDPPLP